MSSAGNRGGGKGGRGGRGGKGGKGKAPKPTYTRVVPKFLQQYKHMLEAPQRPAYQDEDGPTTVNPATANPAARGGGGGGGGGGRGGGDAFEDYDDDEVAAMEEYKKSHPTKEMDKEDIRRRVAELSKAMTEGGKGKEPEPEEELVYVNDGKIKFNRPDMMERVGAAAAADTTSTDVQPKKRRKKNKGKAELNAKLLSFGGDEDG